MGLWWSFSLRFFFLWCLPHSTLKGSRAYLSSSARSGRRGGEIPFHRQLGAARTPQQEKNTKGTWGFLARETLKHVDEAAGWWKITAARPSIAACVISGEIPQVFLPVHRSIAGHRLETYRRARSPTPCKDKGMQRSFSWDWRKQGVTQS